jgi:phage tail tape-measure protein
MSIKITLEFATAAEAAAALLKFNGTAPAVAQQVEAKREAVKAAQPKPAKAPKEEKPEPVAEQPAPAPEPEQAAPAVDYPTVQKAVLNLANSKGRDAALGVLAGFNVKSGKELKPEQYEAVLAALNVALEN